MFVNIGLRRLVVLGLVLVRELANLVDAMKHAGRRGS